jgi:hypothetical protein
MTSTITSDGNNLTAAQRKLLSPTAYYSITAAEFEVIRNLRNCMVKVVPYYDTPVEDVDVKSETAPKQIKNMTGPGPDALVGHDPTSNAWDEVEDMSPLPWDEEDEYLATYGERSVAPKHDISTISQEIHQFESDSMVTLARIMALETDPPPATKPLPAPPTVEYLVTLVKSLQDNQRALLGRLVALEQGRKFHAVNDLIHPFDD